MFWAALSLRGSGCVPREQSKKPQPNERALSLLPTHNSSSLPSSQREEEEAGQVLQLDMESEYSPQQPLLPPTSELGGSSMLLMGQQQQGRHEFDYLVVIDFEATCDEGDQPKVTRDNQEIIEFPWVVIDLVNQQIIDKRQIYVRPEWTSSLTPFCIKLTGITDDKLADAPLLHEAMSQFDGYVDECFTQRGKTFCILTDGNWDLKMCLFQETRKKNIERAPHYMTYFDVKEEFLKVFPQSFRFKPPLLTMLKYLNLIMEGRHHSGLDDCVNISNIVLELIRHGHFFVQPQVIPPDYDPSTDPAFARDFNRSGPPIFLRLAEGSEEETKVVVIRGLPWTATEADVEMFFSGLDIVPGGIHLIHDHTGRPSGVAYVEFSSEDEVHNALQRHNGFMGPRYIEVYLSDANSLNTILASQAKNTYRSAGVRPGDWYCINCGDHQFASRMLCRKCSTPRPTEGYSISENDLLGGYDATIGLALTSAEAEGEEKEQQDNRYGGVENSEENLRLYSRGAMFEHQLSDNLDERKDFRSHQQEQQSSSYYAFNYFNYYQQMITANMSDWICISCNKLNYPSRRVCRKCNFNPSLYFTMGPVYRAQDWRCPTCSDINFASRTICRKCGTAQARPYGGAPAVAAPAPAPAPARRAKSSNKGGRGRAGGIPPSFRPGDWFCGQCRDHNFSSRKVCRKCGTDRGNSGTGAEEAAGEPSGNSDW